MKIESSTPDRGVTQEVDVNLPRPSEDSVLRPSSSKKVVDIKSQQSAMVVLVVERRLFYRQCLVKTLAMQNHLEVIAAASVDEWLKRPNRESPSLILLCSSIGPEKNLVKRDLESLSQAAISAATVVVSDVDEVDAIVEAIAIGARGYISSDTSVEIAIGALTMVNSGGTYIPASSLLTAHKQIVEPQVACQSIADRFTKKQIAVIESLRRGKSNKTIAYELNMCESTVKVHVRNIMKRLKAKNRTQVAFLATELLSKRELSEM